MAHATTLTWNPNSTPRELHDLLNTLAEEYPLLTVTSGQNLLFDNTLTDGQLSVHRQADGSTRITYGTLQAAARGLGKALAGQAADETMDFKTLGIMLDCSRNAVMTVPYLKKWLRRLALMGYNMVMLYTEDTYQLSDEPYFGYLRGGYTLEEMKEVDAYAARLGIEMVGCIQTLGHLSQPIRWGTIAADTNNVLLVDDQRTYDLIDKMLDFWRQAFRSNRIHVGMDETHDLGRGRFMDRNGYERGFDIFNRHLKRVNEQCAAHGLAPIIWSDMYFRMGSKTMDYYDLETVIPEDVKKQIPQGVTLCYWDYYHTEQSFYEDWIDRHRALGSEPHMGSGIWTWAGFWYNHSKTVRTVTPCIAACRKKKLQDVYFTMWGDNGGYCDFDSALAGLAWAANLSWGGQGTDAEVAPLYEAVCGTAYAEQLVGAKLQYDYPDPKRDQLWAPSALWDDPLLGIAWREMISFQEDVWDCYLKQLQEGLSQLDGTGPHSCTGDLDHLRNLFQVLIHKISFRQRLLDAYRARDVQMLRTLADHDAPQIIADFRQLDASFRRQWLRRNKPFGLEIMQVRFAGQIARYEETIRRLGELLDGTIPEISELEVTVFASSGLNDFCYERLVSGCLM